MPKLMIIVGSVREGRRGLPIGEWVRREAEQDGRFEIDWADLKEIDLPLMTEPNHPRAVAYTLDHTKAWSERVAAADAFIFIQPEYNHSYTAGLKNALDYLSVEWSRKPVATVSYGGLAGGSRSVAALAPVLAILGLVPTLANLELAWGGQQVTEDGVFEPRESQQAGLRAAFDELIQLDEALAPLRR